MSHGIILGSLTAGGVVAMNTVTGRIQRRDDIVEPAYPSPPTSVHVSAGPASRMPFDSLGKEGRRFVLMALSPDEITAVMGEPAIAPVRVVGGYEAADEIDERARLTLQDMEDCGAFDRSLICVGSPTGVGYFNYSVAEALEYLTLGDCATVVPQYALVPSALALTRTQEAEDLTRLVLEGVRERLSSIPEHDRPRVVLIGESLGANVSLDIAAPPGIPRGHHDADRPRRRRRPLPRGPVPHAAVARLAARREDRGPSRTARPGQPAGRGWTRSRPAACGISWSSITTIR